MTLYMHDLAGQLIAEYNKNTGELSEYVYGPSGRLATIKADGSIYWHHNDHLGTPQAMTDASGTKVWEMSQTPFGKATVNEDPDLDGINITNNFRFPGQYFDAETGLHYNYFRTYDPTTGRYTQSDPIGLDGGMNTFGYVLGDPVNFIDPLGLFNPAKGASALGNSVLAGWTAASGTIKLFVAAGLSPATLTGVGALPPAALLGWGTWNFNSSKAAWERAKQQWNEALCESWDQATPKNFYGLLPSGTNFDDLGEASGPVDYMKGKSWWEFVAEMGVL